MRGDPNDDGGGYRPSKSEVAAAIEEKAQPIITAIVAFEHISHEI